MGLAVVERASTGYYTIVESCGGGAIGSSDKYVGRFGNMLVCLRRSGWMCVLSGHLTNCV